MSRLRRFLATRTFSAFDYAYATLVGALIVVLLALVINFQAGRDRQLLDSVNRNARVVLVVEERLNCILQVPPLDRSPTDVRKCNALYPVPPVPLPKGAP